MKLWHYTDAEQLERREYVQYARFGRPSLHSKPEGLWVSVEGEDDWEQFSYNEMGGTGKNRFAIELFADPNVLIMDNAADLDAFNSEYSSFECMEGIDWRRVANRYKGIIIAPYIWDRRLDGSCNWYYSWDCASGCIWDMSAIERIERDPGYQRRIKLSEYTIAEKMTEAVGNILPYLDWQLSEESPGYHPTLPSAVAALKELHDAALNGEIA